jgi:hypothetical protein
VFSWSVPAESDSRRGEDAARPASAADETADAGRCSEPPINADRILADVREACRRIRDAWRDAWR